jgi:HB1, ASXL, restriction endonuclease HTH domain
MAKQPISAHSWDEAILIVLRDAGESLHYTEIASRILDRKLKAGIGATPAASVAATLSRAIGAENSAFQKVGRGVFALRPDLLVEQIPTETPLEAAGQDSETGALRAFGMYWSRESVIWNGKPRLLGRQAITASPVDFAEQVGVYLLHDRDRVVYVGRAADTVFSRLKAHTTDRLGGRWDRFSWFGLRDVDSDGRLSDPVLPWAHAVVIETLEALLIECLEPPQNRKRGDFSAVEFLQVRDPDIDKNNKKQVIAELLKNAGMTD